VRFDRARMSAVAAGGVVAALSQALFVAAQLAGACAVVRTFGAGRAIADVEPTGGVAAEPAIDAH